MDFLNQTEAAAFAGRSRASFIELDKRGLTPPAAILGKTRQYAKADLQAWLDSYGACRTAMEYSACQEFEKQRQLKEQTV